MLPFLYIFISQIVTHELYKMNVAYRLGVSLFLFWFVTSSLSYLPHYLSYFNEVIGDRKNMYKYLADSNVDGEQNQSYLENYINDNPKKSINVLPAKCIDQLLNYFPTFLALKTFEKPTTFR